MLAHPLKGMMVSLRGPKTTGDMVEVPAPEFIEPEKVKSISDIPVRIES
jgi:hypothetical protein